MGYRATWDSVSSHPVPAWFDDAKLGVFVHWGLYSVPGWAPRVPDIATILRTHRPSWLLRHNPYAEWYANTVTLPGSPTAVHHRETYGAGTDYDAFRPAFESASAGADLDGLAALCRDAGARYVVLTTKHHDGYCLWPTAQRHPVKGAYHARRDLVGALTDAVRAEGLRMGLYYSGGYDWPYSGARLASLGDVLLAGPPQPEYARYAEGHVRELIARYRPSVLWNDIGWPPASDLPALFADYYNAVGDGVVNDRWFQGSRRSAALDATVRAAAALVEGVWPLLPHRYKRVPAPRVRHADFTTPEYATFATVPGHKWEATRGIGHSFGANRNEAAGDLLSAEDLIRLLVDVTAHNGNLLIGVGPDPSGRVPEGQARPLAALGQWLAVNGEGVYGTRPWGRPAARSADGTPVRFTQKDDALYVALLATPPAAELVLPSVRVDEGGTPMEAQVLGARRAGATARRDGDGALVIDLAPSPPGGPVPVVRLRPGRRCRPAADLDGARGHPGTGAGGAPGGCAGAQAPTDVTWVSPKRP